MRDHALRVRDVRKMTEANGEFFLSLGCLRAQKNRGDISKDAFCFHQIFSLKTECGHDVTEICIGIRAGVSKIVAGKEMTVTGL